MIKYRVNCREYQATSLENLISQFRIESGGVATRRVAGYEATEPKAIYPAPNSIDKSGKITWNGIELEPDHYEQRITILIECTSQILTSLGKKKIERHDFHIKTERQEDLAKAGHYNK